jgi:phage repressor protein C with HTH and peptisase S24 domain
LEIVQQLVIDREWVRQQRLNHTGVPNLAVITGFGDSMEPPFCDGDPLMVDRGVDGMTKDGVYVFSFDNMAHIKRLQHIGPGRVRVISDNRTKYDHWEANLADISIHARVLIGLNVRKME